jgi:flagellar biosynthetic protein FliR
LPSAANDAALGLPEALTSLSFAFMLVLCRCGGAVLLLPALGETDPPAMVRVGLAMGLAVLLLPVVAPGLPAAPADYARLAGLVASELLVGGLLGWLARLIALALPTAGQIISLLTGLSSILQPDPTLGAQSAAIGKLFNLLVPVVILSSGLYALPLTALARSYSVFPAGASLLPAGDLAETAVRAASESFSLALRLAAPFLLISILWQKSLALLSRLVPQIQVYFTALPAQVLGGLLLLALATGTILQAWLDAVKDGFAALP